MPGVVITLGIATVVTVSFQVAAVPAQVPILGVMLIVPELPCAPAVKLRLFELATVPVMLGGNDQV